MTGCAVLSQGVVATLQVAAAESPESVIYMFAPNGTSSCSKHASNRGRPDERNAYKAAAASHALEDEEGRYLKGPERKFARLDCWQACVNGGSHDDAQNCQNDNDPHSGC